MQIREIKIAELPDFVQSELWQQLQPKPITPLRAISQSINPRAQADDVALIIAFEENSLLALVGIFPNYIHGQADQKAASNTGWWAEPNKGRQIAFPLLMKAFALCQERMLMTDLTPHTRSILEKTGRFDFPDVPHGMRGFLKFNLHEVLPAKKPSLGKFRTFLKLSDQAFNVLFAPFRLFNRQRFEVNAIKVERLDALNDSLYGFIEEHSQHEFIRRKGQELEWIIEHPWVTTKDANPSAPALNYPFSQHVKSFEQYFLHLSASGKTIGLLMISMRDGHLKVPYAYFNPKDALLILKVIYRQSVLKNATTLTIFRPELTKMMGSSAHPFVFRKRIRRMVAISRQLSGLYHQYPDLQDGDGDMAFT